MGLEGLEGLMIVEATMRGNFRLDFGEGVRRFIQARWDDCVGFENLCERFVNGVESGCDFGIVC